MQRHVTVRGIIFHDNKLLCVRLKPYKKHLKRDNSYWCLPGGGLEDGESLTSGIEREIVEELGVRPVIGNLLYVQQFTHDDKDYLEFFFHVANSSDYLRVDLSQTTHGLAEIEEIGFIDPATSHILPEFLTTEPLADHIASGASKVISRL